MYDYKMLFLQIYFITLQINESRVGACIIVVRDLAKIGFSLINGAYVFRESTSIHIMKLAANVVIKG